jgi:hypothetical protein
MIHLYLLSGKKVQQHLTVDGWLEFEAESTGQTIYECTDEGRVPLVKFINNQFHMFQNQKVSVLDSNVGDKLSIVG